LDKTPDAGGVDCGRIDSIPDIIGITIRCVMAIQHFYGVATGHQVPSRLAVDQRPRRVGLGAGRSMTEFPP
jgi:hypothetical protein